MDGKPVLVTTAHRGVFFGYLVGEADKTVELRHARNCVYWSSENRGFLGLATQGPMKSAKVGPRAESLTLFDVTSIAAVSENAVKAWEAAPWSM